MNKIKIPITLEISHTPKLLLVGKGNNILYDEDENRKVIDGVQRKGITIKNIREALLETIISEVK